MKVAFVITKSEFGGAQEYLRILMSSMRQHDLVLITGDTGYLTDVAAELGIPSRVCRFLVHPIRPWQDLKATIHMYRLLHELAPDLVHANSSKAGVVARLAALLAGIPAVFTAHGWSFTEGAAGKSAILYKSIERAAAFITRQIICVSSYDERLALRYQVANGAQLMMVHNGIPDLPGCLARHGNAVPRIVMVARFSVPKDYETLLHAASLLRQYQFKMQCVGDGPLLAASRQLADKLGLQSQVEFLGPRSDVSEILKDADIFALVSNWEGLPISVLEGMRAGLPVVATKVGGIPEAVADGKTGVLVPPRNVAELARALQGLIADPARRKSMGMSARERYLALFTSERMVTKTIGVYENILARRNRMQMIRD
jgi:glycosyltransferase involved in cell wall biosynthesis